MRKPQAEAAEPEVQLTGLGLDAARPPRQTGARRRRIGVIACAVLAGLLPPAAGGERDAATPLSLRVTMTEFAFRPSVIRLPAGRPVTIELANQGQLAHQFDAPQLRRIPITVRADDLYLEAPGIEVVRLQPGRRARLTFVPRTRGRFRFACSIEGHAEAGMTGVLDVR